MKKISKEFYISNYTLASYKSGTFAPTKANNCCKNKVTISWEEPEKKIEISESDFDEISKRFYDCGYCVSSTLDELKQKLFGKTE